MKLMIGTLLALSVAGVAHAADIEAGRARVQTVCAACHGATGVSVSDTIPNLAGQKAAYLESQLRALKEGTRKNAVMNAIAGQLAAEDIANVAAYFATQPGAAGGAKSELLPHLVRTGVAFPDGYRDTFTMYHAINIPAARRVQYFYANDVALRAARDGRALPDGSVLFAEVWQAKLDAEKKPVTGPEGFYVPDQIVFYTAMARGAGWGRDIPEMLRNDDWNYAVFTAARQLRPGVNQAECLACHKPRAGASYTFTLEQLAAAAKRR